LDRQAEGNMTLRATVKTTSNQSCPCLFGTEAPLNGASEGVGSHSSQKGDFVFAVPEATKSVDFVVISQNNEYSVPVDLMPR